MCVYKQALWCGLVEGVCSGTVFVSRFIFSMFLSISFSPCSQCVVDSSVGTDCGSGVLHTPTKPIVIVKVASTQERIVFFLCARILLDVASAGLMIRSVLTARERADRFHQEPLLFRADYEIRRTESRPHRIFVPAGSANVPKEAFGEPH